MARPKTAPFSTHSRGVPLFDRARFSDVPRHAARALLDLRDMGSSCFWLISMQSWLTLWSVLVAIFSVIFFTYYKGDYSMAADMDWAIAGFIILLPMVGFTWIAYMRRDKALDYLSESKVRMLHILYASQFWVERDDDTVVVGGGALSQLPSVAATTVPTALQAICSSMHSYFMPARFYSRTYPYFGYKSAMIQIALDRSRHQKDIKIALLQLTAAIVDLRNSGLEQALEAQLHEHVCQLQISIDKMSNIKEFRTPQGIRSLSRLFVTLIIPLFFGPYWAFIGSQTTFAFGFFCAVVWQIALVAVLNVSVALEDPFDNYGLDGIFIDEQLFEVEQAIVTTTGLGATGNGGAATSGGTAAAEVPSGDNAANDSVLPSSFTAAPARVVRVETDAV